MSDALPLVNTALYAGLAAIMLLALSFRVVGQRWRAKVGIHDGGDPGLARAIRVHGNFTEYVPITLVLMGIVELNGGPAWAVHGAGVAMLAGRILHAWGLSGSSGTSVGRAGGISLHWLALLALALYACWQYLGAQAP